MTQAVAGSPGDIDNASVMVADADVVHVLLHGVSLAASAVA